MNLPRPPPFLLPLEQLRGLVERDDPVRQVEVEPLEEDEEELLLRAPARRPRSLGVAEVHRERRRPDGHLAGEGLSRDPVPAVKDGVVDTVEWRGSLRFPQSCSMLFDLTVSYMTRTRAAIVPAKKFPSYAREPYLGVLTEHVS